MDQFDASFKDWGDKPPTLSAQQAAQRVLKRLPQEPSPRRSPRWAPQGWAPQDAVAWAFVATVAAIALLLTIPLVTPVPPPSSPLSIEPISALVETPSVPEGVAVMWLDADTPLYLTVEPPTIRKGNPS